MIYKVEYKNIDFLKYNACINHAVQTNFYAKKIILDFLCPSWEILIYGDYEFVMPIPLKKKIGIKFVIIPLFCQQLGVFGPKNDKEIENKFHCFLKNNYSVYLYQYNHLNQLPTLHLKKNYIIPISDYQTLKKKYFKGRKSTVKSVKELTIKELALDNAIKTFINQHFKGLDKASDLLFFHCYLSFLENKKILKIFSANEKETILNLAILIHTEKENFLLALINDQSKKKQDGASFLIDKILEKTIAKQKFNFMGSSIRGIEIFFKSFGAELQEFPVLENKRKQLVLGFFRN